jgi:hypothetical protein
MWEYGLDHFMTRWCEGNDYLSNLEVYVKKISLLDILRETQTISDKQLIMAFFENAGAA